MTHGPAKPMPHVDPAPLDHRRPYRVPPGFGLLSADMDDENTFSSGLPFTLQPSSTPASDDDLSRPEVLNLVTLLLSPMAEINLEASVQAMLARDVSVEHIYLRLFQPAARRLGEMWVDDACSFVDVTLATALLQGALRRLAPRFQRQAAPADVRRSVLLATLGADQHTFGLNMTAEFFRRAGWTVSVLGAVEIENLIECLATEGRSVVGLSASRVDQVPALTHSIARLRRACRDTLAGVLVGGPLFMGFPAAAAQVGADAVGHDARDALAWAEAMVARPEGLG